MAEDVGAGRVAPWGGPGVSELELTVAVCAYNAEHRIGMVLESLGRQVVPAGTRWELLVVDNASTDGTSRVAAEIAANLGLPARVLYEAEPGLSNARRKAAAEARASVISFLDDDNVVGEAWVRECCKFMAAHPAAGIVGARVVPLFENPGSVPSDFGPKFAGALSMYDQGDEAKPIRVGSDPLPVGAGMMGRREVFQFVFGELGSVTVGRKGTSLAGGEDLEAMYVAHRLGWEIWYAPALCLEHFVPQRKLTDVYLDKWLGDTPACYAWLSILSGRQSLKSAWVCALRALWFDLLAAKYALMGMLPRSLHPKLARADLWRRFYRSQASGWWRLVREFSSAEQRLRQVEERRTVRMAERDGLAVSAQ